MFRRLLIGVTAGAIIALALVAAINWIEMSGKADAGRALLARNTQLTLQVLTPGSALACLDREVSDEVDKACEMAVFESPQAVAAATAYVAARLAVIRSAFTLGQAGEHGVLNQLAAERHSLARDRFGFVAHVLARDFGCTPKACAALAMLDDKSRLKSDLEKQPLDALIVRHAVTWAKPPEEAPVAGRPAPAVAAVAPAPSAAAERVPNALQLASPATGSLARIEPAPAQPGMVGHPVDPRWKFPSADSIPAVSIMTPEPKLSKSEAASLAPPAQPETKTPLPPKRPQAEATPATQAR